MAQQHHHNKNLSNKPMKLVTLIPPNLVFFIFLGGYTTGGPRESNAYGYTEASGGGGGAAAPAAPAPTAPSPLDEYYQQEYPPAPGVPAQPYLDEYYQHAHAHAHTHAHTQQLLAHPEHKYQPHGYTKPYPRGKFF